MKQLGLAMHNYASTNNAFPMFSALPRVRTAQPWSALARLLPYVEQGNLASLIKFDTDYEFTMNTTVAGIRVSTFMCPSEINDRSRPTATLTYNPSNYAFNCGSWFFYDPPSDQTGDGAFVPNRAFALSAVTDGLSNTLGVSETKAFQPNVWDSRNPGAVGSKAPNVPADLTAFLSGGTFDANGHTEWIEGDVHETGFTTTFTPNTKVPHVDSGITYDVDFTSMRDGESTTVPTYAAITARSYHAGGVNAMLLDGSVRFIKNSIDRNIWRGLGTRAGGEVIGDY